MAITLTEKAAHEVKRILTEQDSEEACMLRVGVVGGGCSGLNYDLQFDDKFDATVDSKSEQHGVTVVIDKKSELFLEGTTIDFYESIEARGFQFHNPNASKTCGCGHSFQA